MSLQSYRIISALVLFVGTFFCGITPALIRWYVLSRSTLTQRINEENWIIKQSKLIMSFFMCFGGGVLFATCFIHLLPELQNTFDTYWEKDREMKNLTHAQYDHSHQHSHHFPLPEFIMCGGFLFVYALEEVIYYIVYKLHDFGPPETTKPTPFNQHRNSHSKNSENGPKEESDDLIESDGIVTYGTVSESNEDDQYPQTIQPQISCPTSLTAHDSHILLFKTGLSFRGIAAVIALSFHSLFEGLSVGMQRTENEIWTLLFAIAIHKFVIAVVIGIETVQSGTSLKVIIPYMLVFSIMSPIGMFLAMIAYGSMTDENELIIGTLIAVATGTLIYVTFFEILLKERNSELPGNWQLLGMFVGFITMTLIDSLSTDFRWNEG